MSINPIIKDLISNWLKEKMEYKEIGTATYRKYLNTFNRYFKDSDFGQMHIQRTETIKRIMLFYQWGEYLFMENGRRIRGNALRRSLDRICDAVQIPRRSPHKIRKTYATTLIDSQIHESLVQSQMGHKDISTTRKFYYFTRDDMDEQREQLEKF